MLHFRGRHLVITCFRLELEDYKNVRELQSLRAIDVRLTKICVIFLHRLGSLLTEQKKVWFKNEFYFHFSVTCDYVAV